MSKVLYFTTWYNEKNEQRRSELSTCLAILLANKEIDKIFLLCENCPAPLANPKLVPIFVSKRPTYSDLFETMNEVSLPDDILVLANTDVHPDEESVAKMKEIKAGECYALSRWEDRVVYNRRDSQDVWVFKSPMMSISGSFSLGTAGCDNRIARLIKDAGYTLLNPAKTIKFYHEHKSEIRNYDPRAVVPGPYEFVVPTYLESDKVLKKILHVGFSQPPLEIALREEAGDLYKFIRWTDYQKDPSKLRELIMNEVRTIDYDLIFLHIQTANILDVNTLSFIKAVRPKCFIFQWTGDVRSPIQTFYKDQGKFVSMTGFSNQTDVDSMIREGIKTTYLQIGFDDAIYCPGSSAKEWPEIIFMGNNYPKVFPLSGLRAEMVAFLKKTYGARFGVYGTGWGGTSLMGKEMEEADAYKGCKIAINLSHFDYKRFSSDRIFRIMGSGAFCLSKVYPEMELDFTPGINMDAWTDFTDLHQKIEFYLNNPDQRKKIAQAGCILVHAKHTWKQRIEELKQIIYER